MLDNYVDKYYIMNIMYIIDTNVSKWMCGTPMSSEFYNKIITDRKWFHDTSKMSKYGGHFTLSRWRNIHLWWEHTQTYKGPCKEAGIW